jgi:hypothetical protein
MTVYRRSVLLGAKPFETHVQRFILQLNTCGYNSYVTSSLTREWVCRLQLLLVFARAVILGSESLGIHDHTLLSEVRDSLNLEGHVTVFTAPRNRVAQLHPQTLGSLFVASYESQGNGGGFRTSLLCYNAIVPVETCWFAKLLNSKASCIVAYFAVVA